MKWIVGIDEAGRGPLAGPVAVGVVITPESLDLPALFPGLNDSKKLSEKRREEIFTLLQEHIRSGTIRSKVILSSHEKVDARGISVCIKSSIAQALGSLVSDPGDHFVYLDGSLAAPKEYTQQTIIGGDATVPHIMLASIAAKVTRDRYMVKLAKDYPEYGFEKHKGYGTKAHMERIRTLGLSAIHRRTFIHLDRLSVQE